MRETGLRLAAAMRAGEWWEYKIAPILALFYATSLLAEASLLSLAPSLLLLLAALVPGAVYVSVLNDLADRDEDRKAGKINRMAGAPALLAAAAIGPAIAAGLAIAWLWRDDPLLLGCYLAAWIAFTLYSLPPFRLKTRGVAGLAADSAGAHLFPTLVAILLAFRAAGLPADPLWLAGAGLWAFAHGLRGILWHQLLDSDADGTAGVRTFVQRVPRARAVALGHCLAWPAELAALAFLLWKLGAAGPLIALLLYALLVRQRLKVYRMRAIVVEPQPRYLLLLQEYYTLFLPLALLVEAALRRPEDGVVLLAHLILFPLGAAAAVRDVWRLRRSGFLPSLRARWATGKSETEERRAPGRKIDMRLRWPWAKRRRESGGRIQAGIKYVAKGSRRPVANMTEPSQSYVPQVEETVRVEDVRDAECSPSLAREGFALLRHRSAVTDFRDSDQLLRVHLAEAEEIVRRATGAAHVYALAKTVLRSADHERIAGPGLIADFPALIVHSDFTDRSVGALAQAVLRRAGLASAPGERVAVYNVWRSLRPPPQERPLAICDIRTVAESDLIRADSIGNDAGAEDETEFYFIQANPAHRWCYFSGMTPDEVLVFRQFDSGLPAPSGCPHVAIHDPSCPAGTEPRLSIETRVCAFLDRELPQ